MRFRSLFSLVSALTFLSAAAACVGDAPPTGEDTDGGSGGSDSGGGDATTPTDGANGTDSGSQTDSGPKNFCATQSAPDGAADFFCADFDETDFAQGFVDASPTGTDASSIAPTTLAFVSSPKSLLNTIAATTTYEDAYYEWQQVGAKTLHTVTVSAGVNPHSLPTMFGAPGFIFILGINEGTGGVDFGYSHGADLSDASAYDGYVIRPHAVNGDLAFMDVYQVGTIPADQWTNVTLSYDPTTGQVDLFYDTTHVASDTFGYLIQTDTLADVLLGGRTFDTVQGGSWRFDNFEIATTRSP